MENIYPSGNNGWYCGHCKNYRMIDSGYGWCVRYPPVMVQINRLFHKLEYAFTYSEVPFNCAPCGEFKRN